MSTQEKQDLENISEDLTTPASPNVADTDENLSADYLFQQTSTPSLGRQIFSVVPIHGPTGGLFNIRRKAGTNDFQLVRSDVEVFPSTSIKTGLTQEAMQDILGQYGKYGEEVIGKLLRSLANEQEDTKTLAFLAAQSLASGALILSNRASSTINVREINQKVHELILKANTDFRRTFQAYCVLPYWAAASFLVNNSSSDSYDNQRPDDSGLFVGVIGNTKFFMNPDSTATEVFVGLSDYNPSKSAAVFSPYESLVVPAQDPDTGNLSYHLFNRFAITASPLHVAGEEMMFKFDIS